VDVVAFRTALAETLGVEIYRRFVRAARRGGRFRYWQEQAWHRFLVRHPELACATDELVAALHVCELHGYDLEPDTVEVFHGCIDWDPAYVETRARLFPNAATDLVSTEGAPFREEMARVWYCAACREARATWQRTRG